MSGPRDVKGLKDEVKRLRVLFEVARAVSSSLDLEAVVKMVFEILHRDLRMERATLTLVDPESQEIQIEVAYGLDDEAKRRGRYKIGEGVTGRVVATGEPMVIPNVGDEPLFLDRTRARRHLDRSTIAFICVPVKVEGKSVGALSVDHLFPDSIRLEEDLHLLTILSSMVAQAVSIHREYEAEQSKLRDENLRLKGELKQIYRPENILGDSKPMRDVYSSIQLVAPTRATVMLRGESGTGKELVARAIHYQSPRSDQPFIKVSCAALPEHLLESELFGYERGAFTGAIRQKKGRFELAHRGTLFLDEVGDIPPGIQVKLLRVLQEREFERLGGTETIQVDVRLIAATNKNLEAEVAAARVREDLYYRLNVVPIYLPALRERHEDIPILASHFLERSKREIGKPGVKGMSDEAWTLLQNYDWPGNVRELENAIEHAVVMCRGSSLTVNHFPYLGKLVTQRTAPSNRMSQGRAGTDGLGGRTLPEAVGEIEQLMIEDALKRNGGNKRKAARELGVTERILGYKIQKWQGSNKVVDS